MDFILAICALSLFAILLYTYRSNQLERKKILRLERSLVPVKSPKENITTKRNFK
jgi:hypothetical protein